MSTATDLRGAPTLLQPVLFLGPGRIVIDGDVLFGWARSTGFFDGYGHLEASQPGSEIVIGDGAEINNNVFIKSEGPGIRIGPRALLGSNITIIDSDFHDLDPARRRVGTPAMAAVDIGENVFIGDGVRVLKGVTIGQDSVIGACSVVTTSIPPGVIAAGNPARVIREVDAQPAQKPGGTARVD